MDVAITALLVLSGIEHLYFFVLESLLWKKPLGRKTFRMDAAQAEATATLAVNQGFYNLFLAIGLLWAAVSGDPTLRLYTLGFVVAAAVVGGVTVNRRILLLQGTPAALALVLLLLR